MPEILCIDKPAGITSFDVIRQLRRMTGIRKFGHGGTLDPQATGLLLVGVESGTKQLANIIKLDKEYIAEVKLGEATTTGDQEGEVTKSKDLNQAFSKAELQTAADSLLGEQLLPVSAYSAIKRNGVPLYKLARQAKREGTEVKEVPLRTMRVMSAEVLAVKPIVNNTQCVTIRFYVASGTYIRSLAEALGAKLGYPASLTALRRTKIGEYDIADALPLEETSIKKELGVT